MNPQPPCNLFFIPRIFAGEFSPKASDPRRYVIRKWP
jgi:hypothetical protein